MRGWRAVAGGMLLGLFVAAAGTALPRPVRAEESADAVKARRTILDACRRGPDPAALAALQALADDEAACGIALEALALLEDVVARTVAARDEQGRELHAFYKRYVMGQEESDKQKAKMRGFSQGNRDLCRAIRDAEAFQESVRAEARTRGTRLALRDDGQAYAARVRAALATAKSPAARGAVLSGVAGPGRRAAAGDLVDVIARSRTRADRVAAALALEGVVDQEIACALRSAVETDDSYVRRAVFRAVAAARIRESVDLLVGRMARERGRARDEIEEHLFAITGQTLGAASEAWTDWWRENREAWTPPDAPPSRSPSARGPGTTRYFGLDLQSERVVFVLDCSLSMKHGTLYQGSFHTRGPFGDPKIDIALRELDAAVRTLPEDGALTAIAFGTDVRTLSRKLLRATVENRKRVTDWVARQELELSTNVGGALIEAFDLVDASEGSRDDEIPDTIVVLTDGIPNSGPIEDDGDVLHEVQRRNRGDMTRVHAVYLGSEGNASFLQSLVRDNGGSFTRYVK